MAAVLILSKCQTAENMEKTTDLLRTQVVHVVQNSLSHEKSFTRGNNSNTLANLYRYKSAVQSSLGHDNGGVVI